MPSRQLGFDLELNGAAMATAFVIRQGSAVHGSAHQLLECWYDTDACACDARASPVAELCQQVDRQGEEEKWET